MTAFDRILDKTILGESVEYYYGGTSPLRITVNDIRMTSQKVVVDGEDSVINVYGISEDGCSYYTVSPDNVKLI